MLRFQINRRYLKAFDWYQLSILLLISFIGVLTIYSATRPVLFYSQASFYIRQIIWISLGLISLIVIVIFDYKWFYKFAYLLYVFGLITLLLALFMGKVSMGARRWIDLGFITVQPSELFRVILIIAISKYQSDIRGVLGKKTFFFSLFVFGVVPLIILINQPDLGTGLIIFIIFVLMTLSKGVKRGLLIGSTIFSLIVFVFLGGTLWKALEEYQKNRILVFLGMGEDPTGIGYQIEQSKITVGSGMIFGKGHLKGTQGPLRFLPAKHTDFIFSIFSEEWGFIGVIVIFTLFILMFLRCIDTAMRARDEFGRFLSLGITFMLLTYFIVNIAMILGLAPVVGVPIPFMSYGGSALLANFMAIGIIINIRMRHLSLFY